MSAQHDHPQGTPSPPRDPFLIDGCDRCLEYVDLLGRPFDPIRFREFWDKMIEVEWDDGGHWNSVLDQLLGRKLYLVSLQFQAAFGLHPRDLFRLRR